VLVSELTAKEILIPIGNFANHVRCELLRFMYQISFACTNPPSTAVNMPSHASSHKQVNTSGSEWIVAHPSITKNGATSVLPVIQP